MAGYDDDAAGGGGAAEVDVESNRGSGARDNPNPARTTIQRVALSGDLSTEEKLEAMKRKYDKDGDGKFDEKEVDNIFIDLFSEVQSSEDLKQKNSYLGRKLAKNRKHSLAAIVGMGIVTIAASTAGLVAVNKSVYSSEEKVQGAIVESAFAETQVDDAGVAHLTDKAGRDLTTRATGDVFRAEVVQDPRSGRELTCVRVLEVAKMAGSVASGADARLAVADGASGLEREVLSLAGDYEDSGDALHFGGGKVHVLFDDDGCNVALRANAPDKDEVQDEAPPLEDAAVDAGEASPEDGAEAAEEDAEAAAKDGNAGPFGRLRSLFARGSSAARSNSRARVNARSQADEDEGDRVEATPTNDARAQPEGEDVLARHRRIYAAGRAALNKAGSVAFKKGQRFLNPNRWDAGAYVPVNGPSNGSGGNNRPNNGVGSGNNQGGGAADSPEDVCPPGNRPVCGNNITYQGSCLALAQGLRVADLTNGPCRGHRGRFKSSGRALTRADMTRFAGENFMLVGEVEVRGPNGRGPAPNDGDGNPPGQQQDFAPPGQQEGFTPPGLEKRVTLVTAEGLMYATDDHQGNMPSEAELEELASPGSGPPPQAFGDSPERAGGGSRNRRLRVIGEDNRERVEFPYDWPLYRVVAIDNSDGSGTCTGVVVGRWQVLTSACCVYDCYGDNGWQIPTHVAPGRDSSYTTYRPDPWGRWQVLSATIPTYVINHGHNAAADVAILRIGHNVDYLLYPRLIGDYLGISYVGTGAEYSYSINGISLAGYPADKTPGEMWKDSFCGNPEFTHTVGETNMGHYCDTAGQSGSPIYQYNGFVFAVHSKDGPSGGPNEAFIFTSAWKSAVLSWQSSQNPHPIPFVNGDELSEAVTACYGNANVNLPTTCDNLIYEHGQIEEWQVGAVTDMSLLFAQANSIAPGFNEDISGWDTSSVTNMRSMFNQQAAFNQPLNDWDTSSVTDMKSMFYEAAAFNQPLDDWDTSSVTDMVSMFMHAAAFNQPLNWATSSVIKMSYMFNGAAAFNQPLNWDTSSVTDMRSMFNGAAAFNQPLNWDISSVTYMGFMFYQAAAFNQPLNEWDTSRVTSMIGMFRQAAAFNQPLNEWDTSSVTDMYGMFRQAEAFNQPLNWDTSSVTYMGYMFWGASSFSQSLCWNLDGKETYEMFHQSPGNNDCQ